MTDLVAFRGKRVKLIDIDNKQWEGIVAVYLSILNNEPYDEDAIILKSYNKSASYTLTQFNASEIKSIEIIGR